MRFLLLQAARACGAGFCHAEGARPGALPALKAVCCGRRRRWPCKRPWARCSAAGRRPWACTRRRRPSTRRSRQPARRLTRHRRRSAAGRVSRGCGDHRCFCTPGDGALHTWLGLGRRVDGNSALHEVYTARAGDIFFLATLVCRLTGVLLCTSSAAQVRNGKVSSGRFSSVCCSSFFISNPDPSSD